MPHARTADIGPTAPVRSMLRLVSHSPKPSAETHIGDAASSSYQAREGIFEIRAIRPTDADLIVAALAYTSDETYYRRFHSPKHHFSAKELRYLTEVDGKKHVALVAIEHGAHPRLAAVARFVTNSRNPLEAELAICVHDPFHRQGLGTEMLRRLRDEASSNGVTHLRAMVQHDNIPMRELLHHVCPDTQIDRRDRNEIDFLAPVLPTAPLAHAA